MFFINFAYAGFFGAYFCCFKMMDELPEIGITHNDLINLEKVISSKNPHLLKVVPRFVLNYLKRIIHQDELNKTISENRHLFGIDFLDRVLSNFGARIEVNGLHNLSVDGRWIVASNHPLGGLDGMALMWAIGKVRRDIIFPVNDLLMNLNNLSELFIPINKHGSNSGNVRLIDDTYASDKAILYFPAGLCSRKIKGVICDLEWKKSIISKARAHKRDIIPTFIDGRNSDWFYNLAWWRNILGIKANLEMLYLVDEMYKQNNKRIAISFGNPISFEIFDKKYKDVEWAQLLRRHVYELEMDPLATFKFQ